MRVCIICTRQRTEVSHLTTLLRSNLEKIDGLTLADKDPDVIHILGGWSLKGDKILTEASHRNIPTIVSPIGAFESWERFRPKIAGMLHESLIRHRIVQRATEIHTCGEMEARTMTCLGRTDHVTMVSNAVTSNKITPQQMTTEMVRLYRQVIARHDLSVHEHILAKLTSLGISDPTISDLCHQCLYVRYWERRGHIPIQVLDQLAAAMTTLSYNEDVMAALLKESGMSAFVARIESVMYQTSNLREGFMPIPYIADKGARKIGKKVTRYP